MAVREGEWKLLCDDEAGRAELYHIVNDLGEHHNLADVHAERSKEMAQKVIAWYRSMPVLETEKHKISNR